MKLTNELHTFQPIKIQDTKFQGKIITSSQFITSITRHILYDKASVSWITLDFFGYASSDFARLYNCILLDSLYRKYEDCEWRRRSVSPKY